MITIVEKSVGNRSVRTISIDTQRGLAITIEQRPQRVGNLRIENVADLSCDELAEQSRFMKLDAAGNPMPADATTFAAVQDNQTGLQWSGTLSEGLVDYAAAEKACQTLDLAGDGDWRLPTRAELESILDLTRHKPAADPVYFGDTRTDDWYWTSTPCAWRAGASWCVVFGGGHVGLNDHGGRCFVRAVRSASPAPGQ